MYILRWTVSAFISSNASPLYTQLPLHTVAIAIANIVFSLLLLLLRLADNILPLKLQNIYYTPNANTKTLEHNRKNIPRTDSGTLTHNNCLSFIDPTFLTHSNTRNELWGKNFFVLIYQTIVNWIKNSSLPVYTTHRHNKNYIIYDIHLPSMDPFVIFCSMLFFSFFFYRLCMRSSSLASLSW